MTDWQDSTLYQCPNCHTRLRVRPDGPPKDHHHIIYSCEGCAFTYHSDIRVIPDLPRLPEAERPGRSPENPIYTDLVHVPVPQRLFRDAKVLPPRQVDGGAPATPYQPTQEEGGLRVTIEGVGGSVIERVQEAIDRASLGGFGWMPAGEAIRAMTPGLEERLGGQMDVLRKMAARAVNVGRSIPTTRDHEAARRPWMDEWTARTCPHCGRSRERVKLIKDAICVDCLRDLNREASREDYQEVPDLERFDEVVHQAREVFKAKNRDYGRAYRRRGVLGCLTRDEDKVERAWTLLLQGLKDGHVVDESLLDTLRDRVNYAILAVICEEDGITYGEAAPRR